MVGSKPACAGTRGLAIVEFPASAGTRGFRITAEAAGFESLACSYMNGQRLQAAKDWDGFPLEQVSPQF